MKSRITLRTSPIGCREEGLCIGICLEDTLSWRQGGLCIFRPCKEGRDMNVFRSYHWVPFLSTTALTGASHDVRCKPSSVRGAKLCVMHHRVSSIPVPGAVGGVDAPARSCDEDPKGLLLVHLDTPSALVTAHHNALDVG